MTAPRLSERLKAATKTLHAQAERSGLMSALLRGRIDRPDYSSMLRNLHAIYAALEPALLRHADDPGVAPIWSAALAPALARTAALSADLQHLHGADWPQDLSMTATAFEYAERLHRLSETRPQDLVAHAYVRYLGDLSGGQMLRGIVSKTLHLEGDDGVRFYAFPAPGGVALAARFREGLDAIRLVDEPATEALIDEARLGFMLHARLFEELATVLDGPIQSPRE